MLEQIEVDLVLTDVMMPNLDGLGLLKELRCALPLSHPHKIARLRGPHSLLLTLNRLCLPSHALLEPERRPEQYP